MSFLSNLFGKKQTSVENLLVLEAAQRQAETVAKQIPCPAETVESTTMVSKSQPAQARKITSLIGEGARMRGDLVSRDSIHVSGTLQGNLHISETGGTVSVSTTGVVDGAVSADSVLVGGRVVGSVYAKTLRMFPGALIEGDVFCERLLIDDGARLEGRSRRYDEAHAKDIILVEHAETAGEVRQEESKKKPDTSETVDLNDVMDTIIEAQSRADVVSMPYGKKVQAA